MLISYLLQLLAYSHSIFLVHFSPPTPREELLKEKLVGKMSHWSVVNGKKMVKWMSESIEISQFYANDLGYWQLEANKHEEVIKIVGDKGKSWSSKALQAGGAAATSAV